MSRIDDDFFIDELIQMPQEPQAVAKTAQSVALQASSSSSSSPVDKMRLCIELLNDIACWTTSAARKPIEETINQLTAMLTSVGGN